MARIYVVGIGYRPLNKFAADIVSRSAAVFASTRLEETFAQYAEYPGAKERLKIIDNVSDTIAAIKSFMAENEGSIITILASGDPMFFGIGRRALGEFKKEDVEILPDLSSVQVAFSRIKEPWDNAYLMSMHGGPDQVRRQLEYELDEIPGLLQKHGKLAILTDDINNPSVIAQTFVDSSSPANVRIYVCEKLGYPDERIVEGSAKEIASQSFAEPNLVIAKQG